MLAALILLGSVIGLSNRSFFDQANLFNTNRQIAMLSILAIGIAFVIITGGIDLSVGSVVGLTGVLIGYISSPSYRAGLQWPLWAGISIALAVAFLIGLAQGLLITRLNLQPFIVTLGGMLLLRGVAQVITQSGTISLGSSPLRQLREGTLPYHGASTLPYVMIILIVVLAVSVYLLHFTVFGRYLFAIGGNRDAAEYSGIPVKRVETMAYIISSAMAGVSGVCYAAYLGQQTHNNGIAFELWAIAAAVIGGVSLRGGEGTMLGVLIGAAMLRVIYNGINLFKFRGEPLGTQWEFVVIGSVILVAVILDQVVHIVQAKRRTRRAKVAAA